MPQIMSRRGAALVGTLVVLIGALVLYQRGRRPDTGVPLEAKSDISDAVSVSEPETRERVPDGESYSHRPRPVPLPAGKAPVLSGPSDSVKGDAILISRPGAIREDAGRVWVSSKTFGAGFEKGGVEVWVPKETPEPRYPFVSYKFEEMRMGDSILAKGGEAGPVADSLKRRVTYDRGDVEEEYLIRDEGIEQTFIVRTLPGAAASITVTGTLETNLTPPAEGSIAKSLGFEDRGESLLTISDAVAVDARGDRVSMDLVYADGRLRMTVPGDWVAQAMLPIRIDPIIGSTLTIDAAGQYSWPLADAVYNASGNEWVVFWAEHVSSQRKRDLFAQRVSAAGALIGGAVNLVLRAEQLPVWLT